jgi:hypothetical protein
MKLVDMVLFVGDFRRVTRAQVRAAMRQMQPQRHKLIGCVLDDVGLRRGLSRHSAQPPAAPDGDTGMIPSARDNGRYVGRVSSTSVTNDHTLLSEQAPAPN